MKGLFVSVASAVCLCTLAASAASSSSAAFAADEIPPPGTWDQSTIEAIQFPKLDFGAAKSGVTTALNSTHNNISKKLKVGLRGGLFFVREPSNPLLKTLWATLLQSTQYALVCASDNDLFKRMDNGSHERGPLDLLERMENRARWCTAVTNRFFTLRLNDDQMWAEAEAAQPAGKTVYNAQDAKDFLKGLSKFIEAFEPRIVSRLKLYEHMLAKNANNTANDDAYAAELARLSEASRSYDEIYQAQKYYTFEAVMAAEKAGMLPTVCHLLKMISSPAKPPAHLIGKSKL